MNGNEHQKKAMNACEISHEHKQDMADCAVFGLDSELGEIAGILQKLYQRNETEPNIKKELGDCLGIIAETCKDKHTSKNNYRKKASDD